MPDLFDIIDASWASRWFSRPEKWRTVFLEMVIVSAILWASLGFDSVWEQLDPLIAAVLVNPFAAFADLFNASSVLRADMWAMYGIGDHWSAPVIYGLAFIALSRHLEAQGIIKSRNFFICTSLSLMNIGIFEMLWNPLYAWLQGQAWCFTFLPGGPDYIWKASVNLVYFSAFVVVGVLSSLLLLGYGYKPNLGRVTLVLIALSVAMWAVWVWWPLPVTQLTVQTAWGPWTSSNLFPQTYYAVLIKPNINIPNWVQNDLLHLWNVAVKAVTTGAILSASMVVKRK